MSGYPIDRRIKHATLNAFKADKIPVDSTYFDNTGSLITPKTTITQQGNSFNGAGQLVKLDSNSKLPTVDGSNLTNVISSGAAPATPYSVISAKTSSGVASFITKVSNTEISFDTDSGSTPIKICYPDGSVESNSSLTGITGISTDATYYVIKEKASNPYNTALLPVENYIAPSTPATNQLWLDISTVPAIPKKYNGSAWVITQFVKLGEFGRISGVIGTPISYALNGRFESQWTSVSINNNYTVSDNMGYFDKKDVIGYLRINSSGAEYVILPAKGFNGTNGGSGTQLTALRNAVKIYVDNACPFPNQGGDIAGGPIVVSTGTTGEVKIVCRRNF
jgi:hypothetical protein